MTKDVLIWAVPHNSHIEVVAEPAIIYVLMLPG